MKLVISLGLVLVNLSTCVALNRTTCTYKFDGAKQDMICHQGCCENDCCEVYTTCVYKSGYRICRNGCCERHCCEQFKGTSYFALAVSMSAAGLIIVSAAVVSLCRVHYKRRKRRNNMSDMATAVAIEDDDENNMVAHSVHEPLVLTRHLEDTQRCWNERDNGKKIRLARIAE